MSLTKTPLLFSTSFLLGEQLLFFYTNLWKCQWINVSGKIHESKNELKGYISS